MQRLARLSEDCSGQPLDAFGIADRVDLDDLALADGEGHDGEGASSPGDDDARGAVDQGGKHCRSVITQRGKKTIGSEREIRRPARWQDPGAQPPGGA